MAHTNKVIRSINLPGDHVCVDIFMRPDGSFGFDEYRRDPEDASGWYSIGHHGAERFASAEDALATAKARIAWLEDAMK